MSESAKENRVDLDIFQTKEAIASLMDLRRRHQLMVVDINIKISSYMEHYEVLTNMVNNEAEYEFIYKDDFTQTDSDFIQGE